MNKKIKVGIFMGGMSQENEVSFNSGRTVYDHLDRTLFDPISIFQRKDGKLFLLPQKFLYRGKIEDFENRLEKEAVSIKWQDLKSLIDFVFIAVHGQYAEDGRLQGMLEILGLPYLGSKVFASALSRDKFIVYDELSFNGIKTPNHIKIKSDEIINLEIKFADIKKRFEEKNIKYPCIIKPHKEGSSFGVFVANNDQELKEYIFKAATCNNDTIQNVLVEEKIKGREFTCIVITDSDSGELIALPPTEIEIEKDKHIFDYEQKYMPGRAIKHTPARFSQEILENIKNVTIKVMKILGIENTLRLDGFITDSGEIIIIDPNTITGMAPSSFLFRQAAEIEMNHAQLINTFIKSELKRYGI